MHLTSHNSERDSLDENAVNNEDAMNDINNTNDASPEVKPYYAQQRIKSIFRYEQVEMERELVNLLNLFTV